jgi:hypothetical protein
VAVGPSMGEERAEAAETARGAAELHFVRGSASGDFSGRAATRRTPPTPKPRPFPPPFSSLLPPHPTLLTMAKRKSTGGAVDSGSESDASASSSGSSAPSLIDVDFDFFPANPSVDLIAVKRLLRQLLYTDADELDLHPLAELLLDESLANGVGSTIKVDGEESDPFSFLGVLNLNLHQVRVCPVSAPPPSKAQADTFWRRCAGKPARRAAPSLSPRPFGRLARAFGPPLGPLTRGHAQWPAGWPRHQRAAHQHARPDSAAALAHAGRRALGRSRRR